jgi:hypothetical protein
VNVHIIAQDWLIVKEFIHPMGEYFVKTQSMASLTLDGFGIIPPLALTTGDTAI